MKSIFLYGSSGHAKVIINILQLSETQSHFLGLLDDNVVLHGTLFQGFPVLGGFDTLTNSILGKAQALISIGDNRTRIKIAQAVGKAGFSFATAIHPHSCIDESVSIAAGTVVMAGVIMNADVRIGEHCIINTRACIDHDTSVGDGTHIAPGVTICGGVCIGRSCMIGAGAVILPGRTIGDNTIVGAGATVINNIGPGLTVVGVPAREVQAKK